ncbi:MarR family winged helix-turn-helix transcriptional regulator [Streptococcus thoraltensis]|uniref:MarR family winged helix-turn-helix transcriptional regulator n=1 Tax=Streptococcus thoraltensis TaxID=55085 RepID=UPI0003804233|nr:MarR family transcriptional regulator [Streptococcus thoraltensis]MDY4761824.1 MarR family transcriptional regulator [Streptococcus thoraltensis]
MSRLDSNTALKAMVVFRKAERTLDAKGSCVFKKYQITPTQFSVLDVLHTKGEMNISKLIDSILATSGNMTVVLKNMDRNGWIYRHRDENDKRAYVIGLTDEGRRLFETVLPEHIARVEASFSVLTEREQLQLIDLLKKFKNL